MYIYIYIPSGTVLNLSGSVQLLFSVRSIAEQAAGLGRDGTECEPGFATKSYMLRSAAASLLTFRFRAGALGVLKPTHKELFSEIGAHVTSLWTLNLPAAASKLSLQPNCFGPDKFDPVTGNCPKHPIKHPKAKPHFRM